MAECQCQVIVRARRVSALIVNGFLVGQQGNEGKKPLRYEQIDFCQNPVCERVVKAVKEEVVR